MAFTKQMDVPLKIFQYICFEPNSAMAQVRVQGIISIADFSLESAQEQMKKQYSKEMADNKTTLVYVGFQNAEVFARDLHLLENSIVQKEILKVEEYPALPKVESLEAMAAMLRDNGYRVSKLKKDN